jgi:hypothetical protein
MKQCAGCGEEKQIDQFAQHRVKESGTLYRHSKCRECRRAQCRTWAKTTRGREVKREGILRRAFGLTAEAYAALHASQGGVCAICARPERRKHRDGKQLSLAVDHDHETGAVRGLLCSACNVAIGQFEDRQERLRAAIDYLQAKRDPANT